MKLKLLINRNNIFLIILFFVVYVNFLSQVPQCDEEIPSIVEKLYSKAKNYKKYDYKNRKKFLLETLELEEECIPCIWELAKSSYRRKLSIGGNMDFPKKYFLLIESLCPGYHADIYYYLSQIYYQDKIDCEAVKYFEKFLEFPTENKKRISKFYANQKLNVNTSLEISNFYCDFYSNPVPFSPKVLKNISSPERNEILPVISPDNEQIYFTIEYDEYIKGDFAVHHEQLFSFGEREHFRDDFNKAKPLKTPFNLGPKYGGASISLDNKEMYICACTKNGDYFNCDIYLSKKELKKVTLKKEGIEFDTSYYRWSTLQNLGPNINGPQTWEAQPSLSGDGKTLFFSSARPGGIGKIDIYYSNRNEDGTWSKAINIGRPINTEESDKSPFIHTDSRTLYFASESSDYRRGAGGFDIFFTKQNPITNTWEEPKNIGYPINSEEEEESLIVSVDGHYGYFSSKRKEGLGGKDIFYFEIPEKAKPDKIVLAKGKSNFDDETKIVLRDKKGNTTKQAFKVDQKGDFVAIVNVEKIEGDALLVIENEGSAFESLLLSEKDISNTIIKEKVIETEEIKKGNAFTLNDILYESNSSQFKETSKIVLDGFIDWLKKSKDIKIEIQGHTDDIGPNKSNLALSMDRAFNVMEYLLINGIEKERLRFKGYGETNPKVPNNSTKSRAINRRTDFLIF